MLVSFGLTRRKLAKLPAILNLEVIRAFSRGSTSTRILAAVAEDKIADAIAQIPPPYGTAHNQLLGADRRGRGIDLVHARRERAKKVLEIRPWNEDADQLLVELLARTLLSLPLPTEYYL